MGQLETRLLFSLALTLISSARFDVPFFLHCHSRFPLFYSCNKHFHFVNAPSSTHCNTARSKSVVICALTCEANAINALFNGAYDEFSGSYGALGIPNINGRLGPHDVVLCYLTF